MRKLTLRLPITGLPISSRSLMVSLCSAFVRLFIPSEVKRSCTFWASTDLNGTAFWSGDSARILRPWTWGPRGTLGIFRAAGFSQEIQAGVALRFLCRGRWDLHVTSLRDQPSARGAGRFV